jgi:uncharacterized protein DUF3300
MTRERMMRIGSVCALVLAPVGLGLMAGCPPVEIVTVGEPPPPPVVYYAPPPQPVYAPAPPAEPPPAAAPAEADPALQELVAPIALYPDPLLAVVLPASTYPDQVEQAAQWQQANPYAMEMIDQQPWDPSVKALAHYPSVLGYMASQPQWTQSLGSAFSDNQANVFEAIQDLRTEAVNNGSLVTTDQMVVVQDGATISLQPANPAMIYVPTYDPVLVYQGRYGITYGVGFVAGGWLVQGVDWDGGVVFVGDWHGGWAYDRYGWHRDHYWHGYDRDHYWHRDDRWGRRPYVDRSRWYHREGFRAVQRSEERRRAVEEHNRVREQVVRNDERDPARDRAARRARGRASIPWPSRPRSPQPRRKSRKRKSRNPGNLMQARSLLLAGDR